jgi:2-succinyl-6-hydroxy-2,4-cyclohexadiene-1-carboxylate synthase
VAHDTLSVVRSESRGGSQPFVLLHGFTQNASCWGTFGTELTTLGPTLAFDLPGHGGSSEHHVDLVESATLLAQSLDELKLDPPACVIGYSLGGRTALHLALARPDLVGQLVVIGATGGIDDADEREARQTSDNALADRIIEIGVARFVDEWLAQPIFSSLPPGQTHREQRLTNTAEGLSSSLRNCGTGTQTPLWNTLPALEMPVLVLAGADDSKFCELGERLREAIGRNSTSVSIPNAGHSAHLEEPHEVARVIASWLENVSTTSAPDEKTDGK